MNEKLRYSVIIPVYNAEKTIEKCLDSLLYQIPMCAELIVINDGSVDKSGKICKRYAEKYSAIRYLEKENGGVSTARNMGLDNAKGEYILFVDSDDYVDSKYWMVIDSYINQYHPDMLQWGFRNCGQIVRECNIGDYAVSGEKAVSEKIDKALRKYLFCNLPFRSFKKNLIEYYSLRFETNLAIGEDQAFIFEYAMHINTLVSVSEILYNVVLDKEDSLSRKRRDYLSDQLMQVNELMYQAFENSNFGDDARRRYQAVLAWTFYRSAYSVCKELLKYDLSRQERRRRIKAVCLLYKEKSIKARDIKCKVIAFPISHCMTRTIDMLCQSR